MHSRLSVLCLLLVVIVGILGGGCATRKGAHMTWRMGDYQKLLEKQKAGMAVTDEALKHLPEMTAADYTLAGDQYFLQNNLPMAFVHYDKALRMAPDKPELRYKKGLIFLQRHLAEEARQEFHALLQADDTFAPAHEGLGQAFLMLGEAGKAEKHFQRAIALDASLWKAHNFLGMLYDQQQRFEAALASYTTALALHKDDAGLWNNMGVSFYKKGDYDNAVRAFEKAVQRGLTDVRVYNNLGLCLAKLGKYQEALIAFTRGGDKAKAYNNLGVIYLTEGKYQEALTAFQQALEASSQYYATASDNLRLAQQALKGSSPALTRNHLHPAQQALSPVSPAPNAGSLLSILTGKSAAQAER